MSSEVFYLGGKKYGNGISWRTSAYEEDDVITWDDYVAFWVSKGHNIEHTTYSEVNLTNIDHLLINGNKVPTYPVVQFWVDINDESYMFNPTNSPSDFIIDTKNLIGSYTIKITVNNSDFEYTGTRRGILKINYFKGIIVSKPAFINVGGVWKEMDSSYVNINGVWKTVDKISTNINGIWKET